MIVVGKKLIDKFSRKHATARSPLLSWVHVVEKTDWSGPVDIKRSFPSASFLSDNKVIFNIGGNNFRLYVKVVYVNGIVMVEWIGTHSEYDKKKF